MFHVRNGLLLSHDCRVHRAWHFWYTHACISRQRDRKAQQYKKKQTGDTHKSITQHFYLNKFYYCQNQFYALSEYEAIFKACEWILENKEG